MKKCYLIGAGECTDIPSPDNDTFVIAADGGYDSLKSCGITPQLLIGDLDSIKETPENIEIVRYRVKKDETDMYLSYLEGVKRGYREFLIFGGMGGRVDHTLANISLLIKAAKNGHKARLIGKDAEMLVICDSSVSVSGNEGAYFSVFAACDAASGVSIRNAEYEADGITLTPEFPLGVSNRFFNTPAEISVRSGTLLIVIGR